METKLTAVEARVLGCLVEKELATPEYYPLSLNALVNACNQKNNRDPVMTLAEPEVRAGLEGLRQRGLALQAAESARVARYGHNLGGKLHLAEEETAVLCELLVRGPQTAGELRGRAARLRPFADVGAVEAVLEGLIARQLPLVAKLPRQPGRKESRYAQLLAEAPVEAQVAAPAVAPAFAPAIEPPAAAEELLAPPLAAAPPAAAAPPRPAAPPAAAPPASTPADERVAALEDEVRDLRSEIEILKDDLRRVQERLDRIA
jgi:hypothetical protein